MGLEVELAARSSSVCHTSDLLSISKSPPTQLLRQRSPMRFPSSRDKGSGQDVDKNDGEGYPRHVVVLRDDTRQEDEGTGGGDGALEDPSPCTTRHPPSPVLPMNAAGAASERQIKVSSSSSSWTNGLVDVLYENQRGSFLCGIPLFSAAGLWITDPHAWTAIDHGYTPFTIFNATVPDPSWEWVWKRWFVDMSGDVDQNGWTYNINFTRHHWHGHHIWYHSFVRRRRWLRKRRKVRVSDRTARRLKNPAEDYFTIYSTGHRSARLQQQQRAIDAYLGGTGGRYDDRGEDEGEDEDEDDEDENGSLTKLDNLGDFYRRLRASRLDREKLDAVDNFLRNGKDLSALPGEMEQILQFMIFQESRRQLLVLLTAQSNMLERQAGGHDGETRGDRDDRVDHDEDEEGEPRSRRACIRDAIAVLAGSTRTRDVSSAGTSDRLVRAQVEGKARCGREGSSAATAPENSLPEEVGHHALRPSPPAPPPRRRSSLLHQDEDEGELNFRTPRVEETLGQSA